MVIYARCMDRHNIRSRKRLLLGRRSKYQNPSARALTATLASFRRMRPRTVVSVCPVPASGGTGVVVEDFLESNHLIGGLFQAGLLPDRHPRREIFRISGRSYPEDVVEDMLENNHPMGGLFQADLLPDHHPRREIFRISERLTSLGQSPWVPAAFGPVRRMPRSAILLCPVSIQIRIFPGLLEYRVLSVFH